MNTNQLKRFAQEARIKLIDQIGAKLEKVLTSDSVALREKAGHLKKLQEAINKTSKIEVIDTVAYTWFNRFVALRFMDVNGYEPLGISIVSSIKGGTLPAILQEAKQGCLYNNSVFTMYWMVEYQVQMHRMKPMPLYWWVLVII